MIIPSHLASTHRMLVAAFPNGIGGEEYLATIALLAEHMSIRCLSEAIALAFGGFGVHYHVAYNDVLKVASKTSSPSPEVVDRVRAMLVAAGYEQWIRESDQES